MVLPLGDRDFDVRRLPWITFAMMALCVAVTLGSTEAPEDRPPDAGELMQEAVAFWSEHAYLTAQPELLLELGRGLAPEERLAQIDELRQGSYARFPSSQGARAAEQLSLDALTTHALAAAQIRGPSGPGFVPAAPTAAGFLNYAFVHPSALQLLTGLLAILLLGAALEAAWHPGLYGGFVLGSVLSGSGFYWLMVPGAELALLGSGPVVAALLGAGLLVHWESGCPVTAVGWNGGLAVLRFRVPALVLAGVWLLALCGEIFGHASPADVAYQAQVGGLLLGIGVASLERGRQTPRKLPRSARGAPSTRTARRKDAPSSPLQQARAARARRDESGALEVLQKAVWKEPRNLELVSELWDVAIECGRPDVGCPPMLGLINEWVLHGEGARAAKRWLQVTSIMPGARLEPDSMVGLAPELVQLQRKDAALELLQKAVDGRGRPPTAESAVRAAELAGCLLDTATAAAAARIALESGDVPADQRAQVQKWLSGGAAALERKAPSRDADASQGAAASPDFWDIDPASDEAEPASSETPAAASDPAPGAAPDPAHEDEPAASKEPGTLGTSTQLVVPDDGADERVLGAADEVLEESRSSDALPRFSAVKVVEGVPEMIGDEALTVRVSDEKTIEIEYAKVQALSAAGVRGLGEKPVIIIDLVMNWNQGDDGPLHVVRLRGDHFDPRHLVGDALRLPSAYRVLLRELHEATRSIALPDEESLTGSIRMFASVDEYQKTVLRVDD